MAKTIGGKKPLSTKQKPVSPAGIPDFFQNPFNVPVDIQAQLEKEGLEGRWISYAKYTKNGNSHEKGWSIYRASKREGQADQFLLGSSPDGTIQRGEMVLAARKKEWGNKHREYLRYRAELQAGNFKKNQAEELRQMAKDSSNTLGVVEGYEEDGDDSGE
jgi:hypothetical protein